MPNREIEQVRRDAEVLITASELETVYDRMAREISDRLRDSDPVLMPVMLGGMYLAGQLMPRLDFAFELDYLHATRYRGELRGRELQWRAEPRTELAGRTLLVIDDIIDDGITLHSILAALEKTGAGQVLTAVLVVKQRSRSVDIKADFTGVTVPDRYVFGCGMDYKEYWRNLPAIHAVADHSGEDRTC